MENGGINIILGCFGRSDDDFINCSSIQNIILNINTTSYNYSDIMNLLDQYQLFDKRLLDYNAIRNFIFKMQEKFDEPARKLWSEKKFGLYQKFVIDHKSCGLFIQLDFAQ